MMLPTADLVTPILTPLLPGLKSAFVGGGSLAIAIGVTVWCMKKAWLLFKNLLADKDVRHMTYDIAGSQDVANGTWEPDRWTSYEGDSDGSPVGGAAEQTAQEQDAAASSYLDRYR